MTTQPQKISIGTRGSPLALYQAGSIKAQVEKLHPGLRVDLVRIKTSGDKITDVPLAKFGGKGLFVKEIEEALLDHRIDLAVHSMKDVPVVFPDGLHLPVITEREDPRDALISRAGEKFVDLPKGSTLGTSSLRRQAQLLHRRPDLDIKPLRGNLDTRLRKLESGTLAAVVLAAAGLKRLGMTARVTEYLDIKISLPAIGQGAIAIECRMDDIRINQIIAPLHHLESGLCVKAERAFLTRLEGGCQVPIAAHARLSDDGLTLDGLVASVDGTELIRDQIKGSREEAEVIGIDLANRLLSRGADRILKEIYQQ